MEKWGCSRKIAAPVSLGSSTHRVMIVLTWTRGAQPPARGRKGTIGFIGQCGCDGLAQQTRGVQGSSGHQCPVYHDAIKLERGRTHLYFWSDRGIPTANCVGGQSQLNWE